VFLFDTEDLRITPTRQSSRDDNHHSGQWQELLNLFIGIKWFHVSGNLSTEIVHTLKGAERRKTILPAMLKLYIPQIGPRYTALSEAAVSFMTSRRLSGRPIAVEYERQRVNELRGAGTMYAKC
jgi:hypothetical protein